MSQSAPSLPAKVQRIGSRRIPALGRYGVTVVAVLAALVLWAVGSAFSSPFFVPSPLAVASALVDLTASGDLPRAVAISYFRILTGWAVGCAVAIPIALVAGRIAVIRQAVEPFFK